MIQSSKLMVLIVLVVLIFSSIPSAASSPVRNEVNQPDNMEEILEDKQNFQLIPAAPIQYNFKREQKVPFVDILQNTENQLPPLEIRLKAATFDPLKERPEIPPDLTYQQDNGYHLVQCKGPMQVQQSWVMFLSTHIWFTWKGNQNQKFPASHLSDGWASIIPLIKSRKASSIW
jgi:hypothetical protein